MNADRVTNRFWVVATMLFLAACSDVSAPVEAVPGSKVVSTTGSVVALDPFALQQAVDPFTVRASLDPYRIHQLPDFMIHSKVQADLVIQRLVLPPGSVPWHTHPGPSFVIVEDGQIITSLFTPKNGCVHSPVLGPGQSFYRPGDEVHRLTVVSAENAVLYVARFNIPIGAAITTPADDPDC